MSQTVLLIDTLKKCLKQHGLTYADVAGQLALSETSVKRFFAEKNLSLQRLEKICALMNLELIDLAKLAEENQDLIHQLNTEQEKRLVENPKLLLLAYLLMHGITYPMITEVYAIEEHEGIRLLAALDKLKLIQLLPGNRVKMLTSNNFTWQKNGPIQKYFDEHIRQEFFKSRFSASGELMLFTSGMVSKETITRFHKKFDKLVFEFNEAAKSDSNLPYEQRFGCSLVTAFRPWEFSVFAKFRRPGREKLFHF